MRLINLFIVCFVLNSLIFKIKAVAPIFGIIGVEAIAAAKPIAEISAKILASLGFLHLRGSKKNYSQDPSSNQSQTQGIAPDPNDSENFLERIKKRADKKARHVRFGKFYKDPETNLWWSKDNAGHSGSHLKVFKERATGLEWIYDADMLGNKIIGKHKSPIGKFVPYKELIFYA